MLPVVGFPNCHVSGCHFQDPGSWDPRSKWVGGWKWKFAQKVGTLGIPPSAKVTMRLEHWSVVSTIYS